jgi:hypothetical protein
MNQSYRVRLKTKVKVKIAFIVLGLATLVGVLTWTLVTSELFKQKDDVSFTNFVSVKPLIVRNWGKNGFYEKRAQFQLPSGQYLELIVKDFMSFEGSFCIGESFKNGVFIRHVVVEYSYCV